MAAEQFSWGSIIGRLVAALVLVFATYNAEGTSYYHWALEPLIEGAGGFSAVKFLAGIVLVVAWVIFLQAARRSLGVAGALLVGAICGGIIWFLIDSNLMSASSSRGITRLVLVGVAIILAVGMSWSHLSRRISGQGDVDIVD